MGGGGQAAAAAAAWGFRPPAGLPNPTYGGVLPYFYWVLAPNGTSSADAWNSVVPSYQGDNYGGAEIGLLWEIYTPGGLWVVDGDGSLPIALVVPDGYQAVVGQFQSSDGDFVWGDVTMAGIVNPPQVLLLTAPVDPGTYTASYSGGAILFTP